jgi:hypothetical protein
LGGKVERQKDGRRKREREDTKLDLSGKTGMKEDQEGFLFRIQTKLPRERVSID